MSARFRPTALTNEITVESLGIEVFFSEEIKTAIAYAGKSSKAAFYYRYSNVEQMMKSIENFITAKTNAYNEKIKRAKELKELQQKYNAEHYFNVGDVVYNSWGYEQTNISFYQVVSVTNRQIKVIQIDSEIVEGSMYSHGMACEVMPVKDSFQEEADKYTLTVKAHNEKECYLKGGKSHYYFAKHDGTPKYKSWYY